MNEEPTERPESFILNSQLSKLDGAGKISGALLNFAGMTTAQIVAHMNKVPTSKLAASEMQTQIHNLIGMRPEPMQLLLPYLALYERLLEVAPTDTNSIAWKAATLVLISDSFQKLGFPWYAKRYAMLALCEEARGLHGAVKPEHGSYLRLLVEHHMPDDEVIRYAKEAHEYFQANVEYRRFPELCLLSLDQLWKIEIPTPTEYGQYFTTGNLVRYMLAKIDHLRATDEQNTRNERGLILEQVMAHLFSCMPGVRTQRRMDVAEIETDHDVVCSLDGFHVDYRTEFGRYFVCECKAWHGGTPFDVMAKLSRMLDEVGSRFGILAALGGISGEYRGRNAEAEQRNLYLDRRIVVVVLNRENLQHVAMGKNFISILREKYEQIRLIAAIKQDHPLEQPPAGWKNWNYHPPA